MKFRVYFDDTDAMGVVYHANYLRFCERARSEVFFAAGLGGKLLGGGSFVLASCSCRFVAPARLGDEIWVQTRLCERKAASVVLEQQVFLCEDAADGAADGTAGCEGAGAGGAADAGELAGQGAGGGRLLFAGEFKLACVDANFRPCKISPEVAELFERI